MISDKNLQGLAARARERDRLRITRAVVKARRMTRADIRRAKNRQDKYLFLKALAVTVEVTCTLLVCFLGILSFYEIRSDTESSFYSTQLIIEIVLLLSVFAVILSDKFCLRLTLIFLSIAALIENLIHIVHFILLDTHSTTCKRIELLFEKTVCVVAHTPFQHHSTFTSGCLAIFHFVLALLAMGIAGSYDGTISEIVSTTYASLRILRRRTYPRSTVVSSSSRRSHVAAGRKLSLRGKSPKTTRVSCTGLDITKLPDGTKFKTANSMSFNMEYRVENGMFIGTGTETTNKTINIYAPVRSPRPGQRTSKIPSTSEVTSLQSQNSLKQQESQRSKTFIP